jgi:hypothetical protein
MAWAEALALGERGPGCLGSWSPLSPLWDEGGLSWPLARAYTDFHREARPVLFSATQPLPWVAVLRDGPSLHYDASLPHLSLGNVEQTLLEAGLPFQTIGAAGLEELQRFRGLVLPDVECLSDALAERLAAYVREGGGLLATEMTGVRDEWRRWRATHALAPVFGPVLLGVEPVQVSRGKGLASYLPVLEHPVWPESDDAGAYACWGVLRNAEAFVAALRTVAGEPPWTCRAESGRPMVEVLAGQGGDLIVHVMALDPQNSVRNLTLTVNRDAAPSQILPLSPLESFDPLPFEYDAERRHVRFCVEELPRYTIFLIR